jgi:uncharacterized Zn-finger protein
MRYLPTFDRDAQLCHFRGPLAHEGWYPARSYRSRQAPPATKFDDRLPEIRNDVGLKEMRVGTRNIVCAGSSPPHDHPRVSLRIGKEDRLSCPYCATLYKFDRGVL